MTRHAVIGLICWSASTALVFGCRGQECVSALTQCTCDDGAKGQLECDYSTNAQACRCSGDWTGGRCGATRRVACGTSAPGSHDYVILECVNDSWVSRAQCPGSTYCNPQFENTSEAHCGDEVFAIAGDVCTKEGSAACNLEETTMLVCTGGVWTSTKTCSGVCGYMAAGTSDGCGQCPATALGGGCIGCKCGTSSGACSSSQTVNHNNSAKPWICNSSGALSCVNGQCTGSYGSYDHNTASDPGNLMTCTYCPTSCSMPCR